MSNIYTKRGGKNSVKKDQDEVAEKFFDSSDEEYCADSSSDEEFLDDSDEVEDDSIVQNSKRKVSTGDLVIENPEFAIGVKANKLAGVSIDSPLHPSNQGMAFDQLLDVKGLLLRLYGPKAYKKLTMREVVEIVVKPVCKENKTSYALYRNPDGLKASAFITHSWDENFHTFVESIESVFETTMHKPSLWICAFALFQGDVKDIEDQVGGNDQSLDQSPFVQALKAADFFVVVRNSTTDLYTRIWCVCELIFAMEFGMVPEKTYITGPGTFENSTTSCLEAEAWSQADRDRIIGHLTLNRRPEEVDEMIQAFRTRGAPSRLLKERSWWMKYRWLISLCVTIVVVGLASLSVFFATNETQFSEAPTASFAPSASPTTIEQGLVDKTRDIILDNFEAADQATMNDNSTQQYAALNWVATRMLENGASFSEKKVVQLYSLATICAGNKELLKNDNECNWDGITCDRDGNIVGLNLANRELTGTIPPEIAMLSSNLLSLDLSSNSLSGSLPSEIFELPMLSTLNISENDLFGVIPTTIRKATSLSLLNLAANQLSSTIPVEIGGSTALKIIKLARNKMIGSIPLEIGYLNDLEEVDLQDNSFSYKLPTEMGKLVKVTKLLLQGNDLLGPIPSEMGLMSSLHVWDMSNNHVFGKIPEALWQGNALGNLESLDLSHNLLTGDHSNNGFWNFGASWNKLTSLRLGNNFFRGNDDFCCASLPCSIGTNLPNLRELDISSNYLSGRVPDILLDMKHLKVLTLGKSGMEKDISEIISKLSSLEQLDLSGCKITGSIPTEIGSLNDLTFLNLYSNKLSGLIPSEVGNLANLKHFGLVLNQLSGPIPSELGNLANLEYLDLDSNDLSGPIPSELGNLANLEYLSLYSNQLSGPIPSKLGNLANLESLNLYYNQLSGPIPSELGNLANLEWLYLASNKLSGPIPSELGNLANLADLILSSNDLTGPIPSKLGNLANLADLFLWDNQLSGPIPSELGNLANLERLHLDENNLSGSIPFSFCEMDQTPSIQVDCDEVICYCCVFPVCTQYSQPSASTSPSLSPSTTAPPTASSSPTTTPSSRPSDLPTTTPTSSPSTLPSKSQMPTQEPVMVTIELKLDDYPSETGWRITNVDNDVIFETTSGTYTQGFETVYQSVLLTPGSNYTFHLLDSIGDGQNGRVVIYLGDVPNPNNIVGYYVDSGLEFDVYEIPFLSSEEGIIENIFPTASPSISPSPS